MVYLGAYGLSEKKQVKEKIKIQVKLSFTASHQHKQFEDTKLLNSHDNCMKQVLLSVLLIYRPENWDSEGSLCSQQ